MDKRHGILIVSVTLFVLCFVAAASATNWTVDGSGGADFTRIQDAINNASDGDTILVYSGVYYENVVVDKTVTLKGIDQPVVDANGRDSAITLTADRITLVGFNATNSGSTWWDDAGIKVTSNNNTITGNNVRSNYGGISLSASSNNNTITGNNLRNNGGGISLYYSSNNNTITGNVFVNDGLFVYFSYQNTVEDNTVNGKPLVYLEDVSDYKVEDAGQVIIVNCNNITIENLDLSNTSGGIALWKTENSKISNNTVCNNNRHGISLDYSSNNTITGNNVSNNDEGSIFHSWSGIRLSSSSNNTITGNNVSNNGVGIRLSSSSNNTITGNNVSNNNRGDISLFYSSNNNILTGNNVRSNGGSGISLFYSSNNNILTGNNVRSNGGSGISLFYSSNNNAITGNVFLNDGLSVYSSYQNTVEDNTVNGRPLVYLEDVSDYKVEDAGQVILVNCNNITIENLDLSNTSRGIALWKTENSKISNNTVYNNRCGIRLDDSSNNNTITGNNVSNNSWGGISLDYSSNNTIIGNNVSSNNRGGIRLDDSSNNNTITGNNVSNNNMYGISLYDSSNNNTITGNNVSSNSMYGIRLGDSSKNTITGNNVSNNNMYGISLYDSSNNKIYFNNFINNTDNVDSLYSTNIWNSPLEITYTYDGTTYKSYLGNYWCDYEGTDTEGDGIGDIHYSIDSKENESDDYPLMKPFENYNLTTSAPA